MLSALYGAYNFFSLTEPTYSARGGGCSPARRSIRTCRTSASSLEEHPRRTVQWSTLITNAASPVLKAAQRTDCVGKSMDTDNSELKDASEKSNSECEEVFGKG